MRDGWFKVATNRTVQAFRERAWGDGPCPVVLAEHMVGALISSREPEAKWSINRLAGHLGLSWRVTSRVRGLVEAEYCRWDRRGGTSASGGQGRTDKSIGVTAGYAKNYREPSNPGETHQGNVRASVERERKKQEHSPISPKCNEGEMAIFEGCMERCVPDESSKKLLNSKFCENSRTIECNEIYDFAMLKVYYVNLTLYQ